jgi:protein O-mannosyl-transferase
MSKKSKRNRRPERVDSHKSSVIGRTGRIFAASALTVLVCLLTYYSSVQFGLTGLDDDVLLNTFARQQYSIADALHRDAFMAEKSDNFYRPLQSLTFMANSYLWGAHASSFHRTNVILHCLTACCLLQLLLLLGSPLTLSLLAALVYATNPLFTQAVAWVPGCGDLLLGLFGILTFYTLVKFYAVRKPHYLVLHFIAFSLAVLSKETALILPVIFAVYLLLKERKKALSIRNLPLAAVWTIIGVAYYFLRKTAIVRLPNTRAFGIGPLVENLRVLPETIGSFIIPLNISVLPSFSLLSTSIGLIAIAAIVAIVWLQGKQGRPMVIVGCLWFILLSIPGMMYSQEFGKHAYNYLNHRAYLPMIGILLVLIDAVPGTWLAQRRKEFYLIGGGIVVLLCFLAYRQSENFTDELAFYNQAVRTNPQSALAYNHRGKFTADARNFRSAVSDYDMALRLYPKYPLAYNNRAEAKGALGLEKKRVLEQGVLSEEKKRELEQDALNDIKGAIDDLNKALELEPGSAHMHSNRGRWYDFLGKHDAAIADYNRAIELNPNFGGSWNNRGALKANANDLEGAAEDFRMAIKCDPAMSDPINNLAQILMRRGDRAGACNEWLTAARLRNANAIQAYQKYCRSNN